MNKATVIGAGLAGCEAAWQLAKRNIEVTLVEMKPDKKTPAHSADTFAELVCSNSLRSDRLENAVGLLKEEMRRLGSLIIECADENKVEAGGALAVDRDGFSRTVTEKIESCPLITVEHREVTEVPKEGWTIIASGPLTADALAEDIRRYFGGAKYLSFYDAAAPLVSFESIDMENAFFASRYDRGTPDYINCPMNMEQYTAFQQELVNAREAEVHGFEDSSVFEGCMPIEVMARRGVDTMRYGPMKPVGLTDPRTGKEAYAVVQLRKDNRTGTIYNIVGFQTHLKFPEQKRVFSMIPALKDAEFLRYGVMHRNTYIDSPRLLGRNFSVKDEPRLAFAGQMTGVEGYVESAASGYLAAVAMACRILGEPEPDYTRKTAIGALAAYVSDPSVTKFQPMNVNFGIMDQLEYRVKGKKNKYAEVAKRSLELIDRIVGKDKADEDNS